MTRTFVIARLSLAALVLSACGGGGVVACDGTFKAVTAPGVRSFSALGGVAAIASDDVWAVGGTAALRRGQTTPVRTDPLAEHWDGLGWKVLEVRGPSAFLVDADATGQGDVWAVGTVTGAASVAYHWDGMRWSNYGLPPETGTSISGVSALARDEAWAVGSLRQGGTIRPLVERWEGSTWTQVDPPLSRGSLADVDGIAAADVWAVGAGRGAVTLHWDGTRWSPAPNPADAEPGASLAGVAAIGGDDVWAVGAKVQAGRAVPLILHWDGEAWSEVPAPSPGGAAAKLESVAAVSTRDVWAAGTVTRAKFFSQALVLHYDGRAWSLFRSAARGATTTLSGISALPGGDVWAVGYSQPETGALSADAFTERRCV